MRVVRDALTGVLLAAFAISAASAAPAPLSPGKPAGTQQSALAGGGFVILLGLAGVIAATAIMVGQNNNKGITTPTTAASGTSV